MKAKLSICTLSILLLTTSSSLADERVLLLRPGIDELGITYGDFLTCLETANFPTEDGPRKVDTGWFSDDVKTEINGVTFEFLTTSNTSSVHIHTAIVGGFVETGFMSIYKTVLLILASCPTEN